MWGGGETEKEKRTEQNRKKKRKGKEGNAASWLPSQGPYRSPMSHGWEPMPKPLMR
jgi:hypothetical protein